MHAFANVFIEGAKVFSNKNCSLYPAIIFVCLEDIDVTCSQTLYSGHYVSQPPPYYIPAANNLGFQVILFARFHSI